ncbi:hypothetical protein OAB41_04945 [Gammaproteobacteria bacterium]|nr:hypothetical protein [Gammaproteobacteria bacterium]
MDKYQLHYLLRSIALKNCPSKKGTTEAGIKKFKSLKVLNSFEKGIIAAIKRSKEISNES